MKKNILAIDNGTQSIRALVFDVNGQLLVRSQIKFDPVYEASQPGFAEQSAELYWQSLCKTVQDIWQQGIDPNSISGVAITTQRATVVPVDEKGNALRKCILWLDQREAENPPKMPWYFKLITKMIGAYDTIIHLSKQAKVNWLSEKEPDIWHKMHKYLLLSGYLNFHLTGNFRDAVASQVGYLPFDYKHQKWAGKNDWRYWVLNIRPEHLPELVPAGELIGIVNERACSSTGIPEGVPVFAAGGDKSCEVLGSGCSHDKVASLSFGTTATINTITSSYKEIKAFLPAYPAPVPNHFCNEIQIFRGFWMLNWFKQQFAQDIVQEAEKNNQTVEDIFNHFLQQTPAGNLGLMLQPYWSPGIKNPGKEAKGCLIGFGDVHNRMHVYRAIIEGLLFALREGKCAIEKKLGHSFEQMMVSGGGAQSDEIVQIAANIMGLPLHRPHTTETSGLGAAICVAVGLGIYKNTDEAVQAMSHTGEIFYPQTEAVELYNQLFAHAYLPLYARLQPLYQQIRKITGYPR